MESDRFDDVDFRMIEAPQPPPRRRGRRGLAALAAVFVAGALGLGASALASSDDPTAPAAAPSVPGSTHFRHHGCRHGGDRYHHPRTSDQDTTLRY